MENLWRANKCSFGRVEIRCNTWLTYWGVASQFIVWDASAAFSILAESSLHCSLSLASSVILTRSSVDWSLQWSISPRSLFSTIGNVVVGRPLSLWPYWLLCRRGCRCLYEEYAQRGSNGLLEFAARGAFPDIFYIVTYLWFLLEI